MATETGRTVSTTDQAEGIVFQNAHNKIADRAGLAWQPDCGLEQANLFSSTSFSTTQTIVPALMNANQAGIEVTVNTTVAPGGGQTLTVIVDHFDFVTATYFPAETIGTITGTGPSVFQTAAPVPQSWQVRVVPSGAGTWTVSGSYSSLAALKQKSVGSATAVRTSVAGTTTSGTTILAANATRLGAIIYNNSNQTLFLAFGSGATTTDFSISMTKESVTEIPFNYTGIITGVWPSANGRARVTEFS